MKAREIYFTSRLRGMMFLCHATYVPIASPTNLISATSLGMGNSASYSKAISIDTFK